MIIIFMGVGGYDHYLHGNSLASRRGSMNISFTERGEGEGGDMIISFIEGKRVRYDN